MANVLCMFVSNPRGALRALQFQHVSIVLFASCITSIKHPGTGQARTLAENNFDWIDWVLDGFD